MSIWLPQITPRGMEVWNDPHRFLLCEGARKASKSISIENTILRHAVQWDGAEVCILTKYLKKGEQGAWRDLTRRRGIVDQWIRAGITEYTKPPSYAMASKMPYFRLKTRDGGESEVQLHSLENDDEVEEKFKDTRFSLICLVEADGFKSRIVFDAMRQQLRSMAVPHAHLKMILDTNPPEEGTDHWMHPLFFHNPNPQFGRIHFAIEDNTFLSEEEKLDLWDTYKDDPALLDRYYYGLWKKASVNSIFADVFSPGVHIIGDEIPGRISEDMDALDDMEILRPWLQAYLYDTGWDLGDRSSVAVIGCPRYLQDTLVFDILDEVAVIGDRIGLDEFVAQFVAKMNYWERWMAEQNGVKRPMWRSWSDSSSLRHRMNLRGTEAMLVRNLSGNRINLIGSEKGAGSVAMRKNLLRRLLYENRIFISPLCKNVIAMLRGLQASKSQPVDPESDYKHAFDALTYLLASAMPMELNQQRLGINSGSVRHARMLA